MKQFLSLTIAFVAICFLSTSNGYHLYNNRGADVPFVEVEAENVEHNGQIIGPDRTYTHLASEASGRRAVQLNSVGQYVEFTLPITANSIVVRYSLPDSPDGHGRDATMDLHVGSHTQQLPMTSRYSWFYGAYPFNNNPNDVNPHHFYDETRARFDRDYPQGTKVRLQVTSTSQSPTFTIDLADFELVGPAQPQPDGSVSVMQYGADPHGNQDSTHAFQQAVDVGRNEHKTVYIPEGHFKLWDHVIIDQVTITGAGPWYSVIGGRHPTDRSKTGGLFGRYDADGGSSHNVHLSNFAIIGEITERDDNAPTNAIGGSLSDSSIDNLWLQHVKCGAWFDGRMNNFVMKNTRILDTTADGVNFHLGVSNSRIENTFVRNTGDDGLAMWSDRYVQSGNKFVRNTVVLPMLANNIAIYGGRDMEISDNLVIDTITNGGGIHIANRFTNVRGETGVQGNFKVERNTMIRAGGSDTNWKFGVGAFWVDAWNDDIHANINVKDCEIIDASYQAVGLIEGNIYGVVFDNLHINSTGTYALQIQVKQSGEVTFRNTHSTGVGRSNPIYNCSPQFKINVEGDRNGWYTDHPECAGINIQDVHPNRH